MRFVVLDGRAFQSRDAAHDILSRAFRFPGYYGRNLDALHDLLGEIDRPTRILFFRPQEMETALGAYGNALLRVLRDSARENPRLRLYTQNAKKPCKHSNTSKQETPSVGD